MMKTFFYLLSILCCNCAFAQAPAMVWQKTFGGTNDEYLYNFQPTGDGGYILWGSTGSNDENVTANHGGDDVWVIKLNDAGILQWQKTFGGTEDEYANSLQQTTDGGYILCGATYSSDGDVTVNKGDQDGWVIKLDAAGTLQWQRTFGGSDYDDLSSTIQTNDGGYIMAGSTHLADANILDWGDAWIIKLKINGELEWEQTYGGSDEDGIDQVIQTKDGGYMTAGYTYSADGDISGNHGDQGISDGWVMKLNALGELQWQKTYGGTKHDYLTAIAPTANDMYVLVGNAYSSDGDLTQNNGETDAWVVKIDASGTSIWQKNFGGVYPDEGSSIYPTADGGYIVGASSYFRQGNDPAAFRSFDCWVIKLDAAGKTQWDKTWGGSESDFVSNVFPTADGGFIVGGETESSDGDVLGNHGLYDIWLFKLGGAGPSILCPPVGSTQFQSSLTGASYQWQVNKGTGFTNIQNADTYYSNENTATLQLLSIPSVWAHYQYRCIVDGNYSDTITIKFVDNWTGGISSDWENASNWGCGTIPDAHTDVIINSGNIIINSNAFCWSLTVKSGATVTVKQGFKLTVTH